MSEPKAAATAVEEVVPGVWYWGIRDERIGGSPSSAHAVSSSDGTVLVDPLPLAGEPMSELAPIVAVTLTTSSHQRSSWRLRRELGIPVWAPALVRQVDEEPDHRYEEGETLPGGLSPIFTPGAGTTQHSLLHSPTGVLFTPDLFAREPGGRLEMVPAQYMHDPEEARRSAETLLALDFSVLCLGHGPPVVEDPQGAIRGALAGWPA